MVARLNRIAKAIAAFAAPASVLVADVAAQTADITEDGTIVQDELKLLALAISAGVVTFLAPKNAEPEPLA